MSCPAVYPPRGFRTIPAPAAAVTSAAPMTAAPSFPAVAAAPAASRPPLLLLFPLASSLPNVAAALSLKRARAARAGLWRSSFVMPLGVAACFAPLYWTEAHGAGPPPLWQAGAIAALFVGGQVL